MDDDIWIDFSMLNNSDYYDSLYKDCLERHKLLNGIIRDGFRLKVASDSIKNDERIVIVAMQSNPLVLEFASSSIQDREDIVFPFLKEYPEIYKFVSPRLKSIKEYVLEAVSVNGLVLEYVDDNMKDDYDVVFRAVSNNGKALKYASKNRQRDRSIIMQAVCENGVAISYADSDIWMKDKEIILEALKTVGARQFIYDIDPILKNDVEFILECLKLDSKMICLAGDEVKDLLRVQFIKNYTDNYLSNRRMFINNSNSIEVKSNVIDNFDYSEYENKKKEFILKVKAYELIGNNSDIIYKILKERIRYEVVLAIASFIIPFTDIDRQYKLFRDGIRRVYQDVLKLFSYKNKISIDNFDKSYLFNTKPDEFYNCLGEVKSKIQEKRRIYINTLKNMKNAFMSYTKDNKIPNVFNECIDKQIDEYIEKANNSGLYDIDRDKKSFNEFLESIFDLLERINRLKRRVLKSFNRHKISHEDYYNYSKLLFIRDIEKKVDEFSIDNYSEVISKIEDDISFYESVSSSDVLSSNNEFRELFLSSFNKYCSSINKVLKNGSIKHKYYLANINQLFLEIYSLYYDCVGDSKKIYNNLAKMRELVGYFNNLVDYVELNDYVLEDDSNELNNEYKRLQEEFFVKLSKIKRLIENDKKTRRNSPSELEKLFKKMENIFEVYYDTLSGDRDSLESLKKLKNIYIEREYDSKVDEVFIDLKKSDYSFMKLYYTLKDSDDCFDYMFGNSHKADINGEVKTIEEFIEDMDYVGKWDIPSLGIRHIIYANNEYCIAMQSNIFSDYELEIIPKADLKNTLHDYSSDNIEVYQRFRDKEVFLGELRHILEKSYNEAVGITQKKYIFGD